MSEYQSYEFRAIDALAPDELQAKLRRISSRGEVTATSFSNEYHWGDFKGDPEALMWEGFDVFVYYANWGHRWCMIRLPAGVVDESAEAYQGQTLTIQRRHDHVLLSFHYEDEPPDYDDYLEPWIDRLIGLRAELLAGDRRALMIGWLAGIWYLTGWPGDDDAATDESSEDGEDDALVPPIPPGMGQLSRAQADLADFLYVAPDLLDAVAERSGDAPMPPGRDEAAAWLASQPAEVKEGWLLRLLVDQPPQLAAELRSQFLQSLPPQSAGPAACTVSELVARMKVLETTRAQRLAEEAERRRIEAERKAREAREQRLRAMVGQEPQLRAEVQELIDRRTRTSYEDAVALLLDLQVLAERSGELSSFELWLEELREIHRRKGNFLAVLDRAGL